MKLQGCVLGYDAVCRFTVADVTNARLEDGVLYVRSDKGETPVVYTTIRPATPERNVVHAAELDRLRLRQNG